MAREVSVNLDQGTDYFEHHGARAAVSVEIIPNDQISLEGERQEAATLGAGERYAMALAEARLLPLLVEERRARRLARDLGLRGFGAAAIVKIAREEGGMTFSEAQSHLRHLLAASRINQKVFDRIVEVLPR